MTRALAEFSGPVYMRLPRHDLQDVMPADEPFTVGKPHLIRNGHDLVVFANGPMVNAALTAAGLLEKEGISLRIVNVSSVKPFDKAALAELSHGVKGVVTAEEHTLIGGLASLIQEVLQGQALPMRSIGIEDKFGQSAHSYEDLLQVYGLTPSHIAAAARQLL
jgi:transketolase